MPSPAPAPATASPGHIGLVVSDLHPIPFYREAFGLALMREEIYAPSGIAGRAPASDAPTCRFF
jgi:hypothetical protein